MKVSLCSKCHVTPEISTTELVCPKCGRKAVGKDLFEAVTKWNNEDFSDAGRQTKVVIKDEEIIRDEVKKEFEKPVKEDRPVRRAGRKPVKKGDM